MRPRWQVDLKAVDPFPISSSVLDDYVVDLNAEGERDLLDRPPSGEIAVRSSLRADFAMICDICVEYSAEGQSTADSVFKLALPDLNTLGEQSELLADVEWLHDSVLQMLTAIQLYGTQKFRLTWDSKVPSESSLTYLYLSKNLFNLVCLLFLTKREG